MRSERAAGHVRAALGKRRGVLLLAVFLLGSIQIMQGCRSPETSGPADEARGGWRVPRSLPGSQALSPDEQAALTRALLAQPADYEPRTHHLRADGGPLYTNRLIRESSPYLLQHAHNPVDWRPWGEEAFATARALDRPIFLSIGYSTCHWCHVMEGESFEDEEIAEILNAKFVAVKVDREERPDVDAVYMAAVQLLTGRGGWPMTVVLTPDGEPIFGGTYFPARAGDRGSRAGLREILLALARGYENDRASLLEEAAKISAAMKDRARPRPPGDVPAPPVLDSAARRVLDDYDEEWGGFGSQPKFPRTSAIDFLLRHHRRTGDAAALRAARGTLDRMAAGGIRDHVGGGFHRYSVDRRWLVPHFEKMLYDNALIATTYLEAWRQTGDPAYAEVVREILDYVSREMTAPHGAFYSATDADSEVPGSEEDSAEGSEKRSDVREEGWFFTWTPEDLVAILGEEDAELVRLRHGTSANGNFEGRNILHAAQPLDEVARTLGISETQLRARLAGIHARLYDARSTRPAPLLDDKILVSWNGLMISAFAQAGFVLQDPALTDKAAAAAEFILTRMHEDGRLQRSFRGGNARGDAVLDDYAFFIAGLLDLFEATAEARWLEAALALQADQDARFGDAAGGFFFTASDAEALLTREKPTYDGARPSGNSVSLQNLLRLATLLSDDGRREQAERGFAAFSEVLTKIGAGSPQMLAALDWLHDDPREILLITPDDSEALPTAAPLVDVLARSFQPSAVTLVTNEENAAKLAARIPALHGKSARGGQPTAWVCRRGICDLPTADPDKFAELLAAPTRQDPPSGSPGHGG